MKQFSRNQFHALLGQLPHAIETGIIVTADDGHLLFASDSAATLLELESTDELEKQWNEVGEHMLEMQESGALKREGMPTPSGRGRLEVSVNHLNSEDCTGSMFFLNSEGGQRAFQETLRHAGRAANRSEILSTTLHDVRTPMTALLGSADLLCESLDSTDSFDPDLNERQRHSAQQMKSELERLCNLVQRIVKEVDADPNHLETTEIELRSLLFDCVAVLNDAAARRDVVISVTLGKQPLFVCGIRDRLRQVVLDLLVNALQAIGDQGGEIRISLESVADEIKIVVADDGPGVADELRHRVFDPYVTSKPKGIGLGLYLARESVEKMDGNLSFESDADSGARFLITLPRSKS